MADLFPEGGLKRGATVGIAPGPGATSLALALIAGPSAEGSFCAVVGVPDLGIVAAANCGVELSRLALVPSPGPKWATVVAALLDGLDVVVLRPPCVARPAEARRLEARARERGAVLVVLSCPGWPGRPELRLEVTGQAWRGLGEGFGYLAGHELEVEVFGRGAASRPRRGRLRLGEAPALGLLPATSGRLLPALPVHPTSSSLGPGWARPPDGGRRPAANA